MCINDNQKPFNLFNLIKRKLTFPPRNHIKKINIRDKSEGGW